MQKHKHKCEEQKQVYKFKIDSRSYTSDNDILTGSEILILAGKTPPGDFELFQKLKGGELKAIDLNESVSLSPKGNERFFINPRLQLPFEIIVNAQPKMVTKSFITFEEIIELAYPGTTEPNVIFTMTYRKAASKPHSGELAAGNGVEIKKKGSIFNVTKCIKS